MQSVRTWAEMNQCAYVFYDDSFFEFAPNWYRKKVDNQIHLVTDLARLVAIRELLSSGYDQVVWIDADVIVFDPTEFKIPDYESFGFGLELWLNKKDGQFVVTKRVHNAVMHFRSDNSFLEEYIAQAERVVRGIHQKNLRHTLIGTDFLTDLHSQGALPLLTSCALFSPIVVRAVARNKQHVLSLVASQHPTPISCANLCSTFRVGNTLSKRIVKDRMFELAIEQLTRTKGEIFNRFVPVTGAYA